MNQPTLSCAELHDLRKRVERLEGRMTRASSRVHALGPQINTSRRLGGAGLALLLLVIALAPLARPQRWWRPGVMAPFEVLDDQNNLILKISGDGQGHWLGLYPPGTSPKDADLSKAELYASIPEGGTALLKTQIPGNPTVAAGFGVDGGAPALVLRYDSLKRRLSMGVPNGKPELNLVDAAGRVVVDLAQGESGGGRLMLTNATGGTIMQAGTTASGVGTVTVFPQGRGAFLPTAPIAGGAFALKEANRLPGTFICGTGCAGH